MKAKTIFILLVVVIVAIGGIFFLHRQMSRERAMEAENDQPITAAALVEPDATGQPRVILDEETQKRVGIETELLTATNLSRQVKGFGRVLDPAPLVALVAELETAQVAATNSQQELERLKSLGENVSAKNLQAAEAGARRDELAVRSAESKLVLTWGKNISGRNDLSHFIESLATGEIAIVRIDLPLGENLSAPPKRARIVPLANEKSIEAEFLAVAPAIESSTLGHGFLFLAAATKPSALLPGTSVAGYLPTGEAASGVAIPRSAVVRFESEAWVYLQSDSKTFSRRGLTLDFPTASGWFVTNHFQPGEKIVVSGAQTLLSEEHKSQVKMAD